jgi:hypothetical protein
MSTLQQLAEKNQPETASDQVLSGLLTILEAGKKEDRSVNHLLKMMHEAAQLELQDLEADFQFRLQESVLQTEVKLKHRFDDQEQRLEEELRVAESRWNTERDCLGQRIATLEEEIACSNKIAQQLHQVRQDKTRLEEELRRAYACRNLGDPRLEKLRRSKTLPTVWEL